MNKRIAFGIAGILTVTFPLLANAQSFDLGAKIEAMLAQISQLKDQLTQLQPQTTPPFRDDVATRPSGLTLASCVTLSRTLIAGDTDADSDGDVTKLQQFLKTSGEYSGTITGHMGPATILAVQKWQATHGLVSSGTPGTTGYGAVGPATRLKMDCGRRASFDIDPNPSPSCIAITHDMGPDDTDAEVGGDVTRLQKFLRGDGSEIYPSGRITGYYGPATMRAVQRWQTAHGLLSSGDPDSNGFGTVGPKTRKAMNEACKGGKGAGKLIAAPSSGQAPLSVGFFVPDATVETTYDSIDFGDDSSGSTFTPSICAAGSTSCGYSMNHTYTAAGTYTAKLIKPCAATSGGVGCTPPSARVAATATVTVGGQNGPLTATPQNGPAPLAVRFQANIANRLNATIDFGDQTPVATVPTITDCVAGTSECPQGVVMHTYATNGTYTATLVRLQSSGTLSGGCTTADCETILGIANAPIRSTLGTVRVMVGGATTTVASRAWSALTNVEKVQLLYIGYLNRTGSTAEIEYWLSGMRSGMTLAQVAQSIGLSTEAKSVNPYLALSNVATPEIFVDKIFDRLFNRAPDAAGKAHWVSQLTARAGNASQIAQIILDIESGAQGPDLATMIAKLPTTTTTTTTTTGGTGTTATTVTNTTTAVTGTGTTVGTGAGTSVAATTFASLSNAQKVQLLYIGYLNRTGSNTEVSYWTGGMSGGMTIAQVAQSIGISSEAKSSLNPYFMAPNVADPGLFVDSIYHRLFGHAADATGKAYWVSQLNARAGNSSQIAQIILDIEFGAQGPDLATMLAKLFTTTS